MDALALAAASALVSVLAAEGWQDGRRAVVALWRRARPEQVPVVEADLAASRTELLAAREAGDEQAERALVTEWRQRLRRLAAADPEAARELRRIADAALRAAAGGRPTLVKGIVEAVGDFSGFWPLRATQVNRVIVVTRHGADACDAEYAEDEIRQRVASAGLKIQFRVVGHQVPREQRDRLRRIASAAGAPEPVFTETAEQLRTALDWLTNTEPVRTNAYEVIRILDPIAKRVDAVPTAL